MKKIAANGLVALKKDNKTPVPIQQAIFTFLFSSPFIPLIQRNTDSNINVVKMLLTKSNNSITLATAIVSTKQMKKWLFSD